MNRTKINVLIVAMLILCTALSMGCVSDTNESKALDTPASVFVEETKQKYDDEAYLQDVSKYFDRISPVVENNVIHCFSEDYTLIESDGKAIQNIALSTLSDLKQHTISPRLQPFADELKASVEDMYQSGLYLESGAHNQDTQDILIAATYMEQSTEHLESALLKLEVF